jgi:hypothetical protein
MSLILVIVVRIVSTLVIMQQGSLVAWLVTLRFLCLIKKEVCGNLSGSTYSLSRMGTRSSEDMVGKACRLLKAKVLLSEFRVIYCWQYKETKVANGRIVMTLILAEGHCWEYP